MRIGISILAYGQEHITECLKLINSLINHDLHFYVITDSSDSFENINNITIIDTKEPFNYNLKRIAFKKSLEENDCVIMMDTDMFIKKGIDFSFVENLEDGLFLRWKNVVSNKTVLSSEIEYNYINEIKLLSGIDELFFIDESTLIFKITDNNKKRLLVDYWDEFFNKTKKFQPTYRNEGAVEGLLIYVSTLLSGIKIYEVKELFQSMIHYKKYHNINIYDKTLL